MVLFQVQGDNKKKDMEAMTACKLDDVLMRNWLIRFVNSQMLLKGTEARGHLIMSAAKVTFDITFVNHFMF